MKDKLQQIFERHFKMLEDIVKHTSQSKSLSEVL